MYSSTSVFVLAAEVTVNFSVSWVTIVMVQREKRWRFKKYRGNIYIHIFFLLKVQKYVFV
jgi:hypothetical protein